MGPLRLRKLKTGRCMFSRRTSAVIGFRILRLTACSLCYRPNDLSEQASNAEEESQNGHLEDRTSETSEKAASCSDLTRSHITEPPIKWSPALISRHPTPVISATWYPSASHLNASTYCFVASTRDRPIRLIDAHDGRVSFFFRMRGMGF
jgi:hypothetical protein